MTIPGSTLRVTICLLVAAGFPTVAQTPNPVAAPSPIPAFQQPELFIDKCPTTDPAYAIIRADFAILRDGNPVPAIQCVEPFSAIPPAQYSEELIIVQALRMAFYMDQGRANYLPWTPLRFYDWVKSKISYFNILSNATAASCCAINGTKKGIFWPTITDTNTRKGHLTLRGVASVMALIGHETRHVDGYLHISCCSTPNGCDQSYNENDLSSYGIQYYLQRLILTGQWNLNLGCLDPAQLGSAGAFQIADANNYANRFCTVKPPTLPTDVPAGAACDPGPYPYISPAGIANAASYKTDEIAPGSLIGIFGPNLTTETALTPTLPLPPRLANVSVDIDGYAAPLLSANTATPTSLAQLDAQVPYELAPGLSTIRVTANGNTGFRRQLKVMATGPGIFAYGNNHAVVINQDGSVNATDNPANAGSYAALYFTGQGAANPPVPTGAGAPSGVLSHASAPVVIQVGGLPVTNILFVGLTPQTAGVSQANFQLPANLPPDDYKITLTIAGQTATGPLITIN